MTADGRVPPERPQLGFSRLVAGAPVRAQQWLDAAMLGHWIAGCGQIIIPGHSPRYALASGSVTIHYRVPLSGRAIARVACLGIRSDTGATRTVTVTMGSGSSGPRSVGLLTFGSSVPIYVQDDAVTRTNAVTDIDITVSTSGPVIIESVTVYELPRASLSRDATDGAVALDTLFPRRPIFDADPASVRGVARLMLGIDGRRIGHFARWGEGLSRTSGSFVSLITSPTPLVPRYAVSGSRKVRVYLRGRVSTGGTTGEWRIVAGSGATATGTITGTSAAWQGFVDVLVMCEDPSTANGLQGGAYDTLDVQARRTAGGGQVLVESWNAVEFE